jgi:hypothetical protein
VWVVERKFCGAHICIEIKSIAAKNVRKATLANVEKLWIGKTSIEILEKHSQHSNQILDQKRSTKICLNFP